MGTSGSVHSYEFPHSHLLRNSVCVQPEETFGYKSMVGAAFGITRSPCLVWLHHFFTMGAGADVKRFFRHYDRVIAIPTGVQVFNWLADNVFEDALFLISTMYWS